jgi:uncharacterized lipoprotein YehR (DUF1307 family)
MNKPAIALVLALAVSGCGKDKDKPKEVPAEGSGSATAVTPAVPPAPLGSAAAGSGSDEGSGSGVGSAGDTAAALEKLEVEYAEVDKQIEATVAAVEAAKSDADRQAASAKLDELMKRQGELADQRKVLKAKAP